MWQHRSARNAPRRAHGIAGKTMAPSPQAMPAHRIVYISVIGKNAPEPGVLELLHADHD